MRAIPSNITQCHALTLDAVLYNAIPCNTFVFFSLNHTCTIHWILPTNPVNQGLFSFWEKKGFMKSVSPPLCDFFSLGLLILVGSVFCIKLADLALLVHLYTFPVMLVLLADVMTKRKRGKNHDWSGILSEEFCSCFEFSIVIAACNLV